MTTDHTNALRKAVAAQKTVIDAMQTEAKRIADEREKTAAGDVAIHNPQNTTGEAKGT